MRTIFFLLICVLSLSCSDFQESANRSLAQEDWQFKNVADEEWLKAKVPGTVHTDLMAADKIPDPFLDVNENEVQWVEEEDWEYQTSFEVSADELKNDEVELVFDGLDTYAEIFVNGESVMETDNMFRQWRIPVKKVLKEGENELRIKFDSSVKRGEELAKEVPFETPETPRAFVRKAQYQFGWDWGPRLVTAGIWKDVRLEMWNAATIRSVQIDQKELTEDFGKLDFKTEIEVDKAGKYSLSVDGKEKKEFELNEGMNEVRVSYEVQNPDWWQPNGWGEPHLYEFDVTLSQNGNKVSGQKVRHGFRTVELIQEEDEVGESFYFKVNGKPLYIKGTNWIPGDSFTPRITKEKYQQLIRDAKDSHMNMIRIWGGGIYEDEEFYKAADENGILVWQDFMFAGSFYPSDEAFLDNVKQEVEYQAKRLQNHPSVAIWCGNNEIDEAIVNWGYQRQFGYSKEDSLQVWKDYRKVFHEVIPNTLAEVLPENKTIYVPTSPKLGWGHKESLQEADSHYWGVWHGEEPLEAYNEKVGRFMSEYGFLSMPSMQAVEAMFSGEPDYSLDSDVVKHHQKHLRGWELVDLYLHRDYVVPEDFQQYDYLSQLLQARAMRIAIEAHRRNQPYNMGTLIWQLNDVWPVASWSGIDYLGNWKAMQYQTRRSYEPQVILAHDKDEELHFYAINDELKEFKNSRLNLKLVDFKGEILEEYSPASKDSVLKNIMEFDSIDTDELLKGNNPTQVFLNMDLLDEENEPIATGVYFFARPKDLELEEPELKIKFISDTEIEISTDVLAKRVFLFGDTHYSDNYFDLLPGESKRITLSDALDEVKAMSLWDTMK